MATKVWQTISALLLTLQFYDTPNEDSEILSYVNKRSRNAYGRHAASDDLLLLRRTHYILLLYHNIDVDPVQVGISDEAVETSLNFSVFDERQILR